MIRGDHFANARQTPAVEPIDPFEGGIFHGIEAASWTSSVNDLCLEQPIDRFGKIVGATVADGRQGTPSVRATMAVTRAVVGDVSGLLAEVGLL